MSQWQDAEQHADKALDMYERGRWAEAEVELRKALQIDPDQGDWHFNLGLTLERTQRDAEALSSFEQAARLLPEAIDPQIAVGAACFRLDRFEESISWLEGVLKQKPATEVAWSMLIDANAALGNHDAAETSFYMAQDALAEQSASILVSMSCSLCARKELDRAIWCAREALKIDQDVIGGRLQLANALVSSGNGQQASQILLQELREDPGNVQALLLHADVLAETGRTNEALIKLHRVLELEPANIEAHIRAGKFAIEESRWEEAFIAWGLVRRLSPEHSTASLHLAQTLVAMNRAPAALPLLQEYGERFDDSTPLITKVQLCELLLASGDHATAVKLLKPMCEVTPETDANYITILRLLAVGYFANNQIIEGAAVSRKVLKSDSKCLSSIHNLALASLTNQRYRSAWGWVNRGLAIDAYDDELRRLKSRLIWAWIGQSLKRLTCKFYFLK